MAKIALGNAREAFQSDCIQALIVEFICTFLFVFAGVGAAMATDKLNGDPLVGLFFVAMAHALVVAVMISAGFRVSGGHINPAVTLGLLAGGHITVVRSILYWIDQLLASTAACALLKYLTGGLINSIFFSHSKYASGSLIPLNERIVILMFPKFPSTSSPLKFLPLLSCLTPLFLLFPISASTIASSSIPISTSRSLCSSILCSRLPCLRSLGPSL
ncbi:aquaporin TIP4-1, partial [Olea europaea subsp. europaea]